MKYDPIRAHSLNTDMLFLWKSHSWVLFLCHIISFLDGWKSMKGNFYICCLVLYMDLILQENLSTKKVKHVLKAEFWNE